LLKVDTLFKSVVNSTGLNLQLIIVVIGLVFVFVSILLLYWFFGTEIGSAIRATGANKQMVRALGVNTNTTIIFGLMLSNALVAMSGALIAQTQGSADIKMGIGAIVIGLASIIIGESFFKKRKNFALKLFTIVIGSIVYRIVVALVLQLGLSTDDLKLFTAVLVAIFLALPHVIASQRQNKLYKEHKGGIQ
jgi:putative ABC transport system permease protein